jgi:hypothetical protein
MTIESLGRKGGPKPGDLGAAPRHSRRPQPETRIVPTARPKPAPPRTPPGMGEARRAVPQPPAQRPQGPQGPQGNQRNQGTQAPQTQQAQQEPQAQAAQAQTQARVTEAKPARPPEAQGQSQSQTARDRGPAPNPGQQKPRGRGDGKTENRGERSLYDGGSPSANRLGPAKAMRARDVSRPRDW